METVLCCEFLVEDRDLKKSHGGGDANWGRGKGRANNRFGGLRMLDVLAVRLRLQRCVGGSGTVSKRCGPI